MLVKHCWSPIKKPRHPASLVTGGGHFLRLLMAVDLHAFHDVQLDIACIPEMDYSEDLITTPELDTRRPSLFNILMM